MAERYADAAAQSLATRACALALQADRLLLAEDAEQYGDSAAE
jgi:hypothetical protein